MHSGKWQKHLASDLNRFKKIPVRQETIEICEFFGINPYELISSGSMLMAAADGNLLVNELKKQEYRQQLSEKQQPEMTEFY